MKTRNLRIRRPDPLILLAVLVGLGVVLTTSVQAGTVQGLEQPDELREAGTRLALHPVKGLAERLDLHWLNSTLERPAVNRALKHRRLGMGMPFGRKGPELNLSWRPKLRTLAPASGDSGIGAASVERPTVYFSLRRSW